MTPAEEIEALRTGWPLVVGFVFGGAAVIVAAYFAVVAWARRRQERREQADAGLDDSGTPKPPPD